MVRPVTHLAAATIAAALLLTGFGGAIAVADTPAESAGSEAANTTASDGDSGPSSHSVENNPFSSDEKDKPDDPEPTSGEDPEQPGDAPIDEKQPADHDDCTIACPGDKTINRVPLPPQAPVDLAPLPEAPFAPGLETPPPADLPPRIPATPTDPDTLDSVAGGGHLPGGNAPPVVTVPVLVAPAPLPSVHVVGASIAPRGTTGGRALDALPRSAGEPSPRLVRASAVEPPLRKPSPASFGVSAPGQIAYQPGYHRHSSRPLAQMVSGVLPGVVGLMIMTAGGICLGYRQASTAQRLRTDGVARFVN